MSSPTRSGRLFAEFFVVLVSILAAFGVDEFREKRTADALRTLALSDFDLSQQIATAYDDKERGVDATVTRLVGHVFTLSTFQPDKTEPVMMLMAGLAGELLAQETQLRSTLDELLSDFPR